MAATGIAALLIENGRTMHSGLRMPINIDNSSMLRISI